MYRETLGNLRLINDQTFHHPALLIIRLHPASGTGLGPLRPINRTRDIHETAGSKENAAQARSRC